MVVKVRARDGWTGEGDVGGRVPGAFNVPFPSLGAPPSPRVPPVPPGPTSPGLSTPAPPALCGSHVSPTPRSPRIRHRPPGPVDDSLGTLVVSNRAATGPAIPTVVRLNPRPPAVLPFTGSSWVGGPPVHPSSAPETPSPGGWTTAGVGSGNDGPQGLVGPWTKRRRDEVTGPELTGPGSAVDPPRP